MTATLTSSSVSPTEAAERLGMHVDTVTLMLRTKELHGHKRRGRWRIPVAVFEPYEAGLSWRAQAQASRCACGGQA